MPDPTTGPLLILDADGVFMDERPYWNAALGTALIRAGLADDVAGRWDDLALVAFGATALQRVAKLRGCNSNWDLAAVLEVALGDNEVRGDVRHRLRVGDMHGAAVTLRDAADTIRDPLATGNDPLSTFGIDRESAGYDQTREHYQRVLFGGAGIDWRFERTRLREPRGDVVRAFEAFRDLGYELRVCTGRGRNEIERPLEELGLSVFLSSAQITSADEVARAESEVDTRPLGKPHAFPALCALWGYERARDEVATRLVPTIEAASPSVFIGDGWSDYLTVRAARARGARLEYVHVRSPIVAADQLAIIEAEPFSLGSVDRLGEVVPLLTRVPA